MIQLKNKTEIAWIRESCQLLMEVFKALGRQIEPGNTTYELDKFADDFIVKRGGRPWFKGYMGYPASLCVSINRGVIHGIPGRRRLEKGDIVSLDLGVDLKGYFSDSAYTYPVGTVSEARLKLMQVTMECLELGTAEAIAGNRVRDISRAVYEHASKHGYGVVRQFCGHGVGFAPHEEPQIPNYLGSGPNPRLKSGMVLAIEPMINEGAWEVKILGDDWTVETIDGRDSAHFEYTLALFSDHTEILTPFD